MIDTPDVPETLHFQRERSRLQAPGHRTDDGSMCTLLIINETDGTWTIHGLAAPGVRLTKDKIVALAAQILERAR